MKYSYVRLTGIGFVLSVLVSQSRAADDDYEFLPAGAQGGIGSKGSSEASSALVLGFPGGSSPGKNRWLEPIDGVGGFDNVAPRLAIEDGPGGLEWDVSPTFRSAYKGGKNYPGTTKKQLGYNWFFKIPYIEHNAATSQYFLRCEANAFCVYDKVTSTKYEGTYANERSTLDISSSPYKIYDQAGKILSFDSSTGRITKIEGVGDAEITFTYSGTSTITVAQKSDSSTEVRRFVYTLESSGTLTNKIEVQHKVSAVWTTYRTIDFTYHQNVSGATGSSSGDLVAIEDKKNLSESGKDVTMCWLYKYYTSTYSSSTNPGHAHQVEAIFEPGSVQEYLAANPTKTLTDMIKSSSSALSSYADRTYEYESDRRVREIIFKDGCGCGGSTGTFDYSWTDNGTTPSDLNTWKTCMTLEKPDGSAEIVDFNKYGQKLNAIIQEDATNSSSRRWIRTWRYDADGRLTDSYSVSACSSYNDTTHVVTLKSTGAGKSFMHYKYAYDSNGALETVKLVDPTNGNENFIRKLDWTLKSSGDRERYLLDSETRYPKETTTDTGGETTSYSFTFHSADALAVKKRTTTLPVVTTEQNGKGTAYTTKQYFELDGKPTWHLDAEGNVHYRGFDSDRGTVTIQVTDIDTDTADRPSGVPAAPDTDFASSDGLNIVTRMEYDDEGRLTKRENPEFDAYDGSSITATKTTQRIHYTRLAGGELVTLSYGHVDSAYSHSAVGIEVRDHDGNTLTSALGELAAGFRDTDLSDDVDDSEAAIEDAFEGTIIQRTDFTYEGSKLTEREVWSDADNSSGDMHTTSYAYDAQGRLETMTTPAATITRYEYDVLGRRTERHVGTIDGGIHDNMTLVEESFFDDEEDTSSNVGDGMLTRRILHTSYTTETEHPKRTTDWTYDYRGRITEVEEPLDVVEERDYDNLNRVTQVRRYDESGTSTLVSQSESFYDSWGQVYETRVYSVPLTDSDSDMVDDHSNTLTWRDGRGLVIKTLSQGDVFQKQIYDGGGRLTTQAVCYDTDESTYTAADDLSGDTVVEMSKFDRDAMGRIELTAYYQRQPAKTGTGELTVGSSGNSRPQFTAVWYDEFGRQLAVGNYGTNGGTDLSSRPSGVPPTSSSTALVTEMSYTVKGQVEDVTDPEGIVRRTEYTDWGAVSEEIENYVDGVGSSGTADDDRIVEYAYNEDGQLESRTAVMAFKDSGGTFKDQVTEYVYGVTPGSADADSRLASNELVEQVKYPDKTTGAASTNADEHEFLAYNAQGEQIYKVFASPGNKHVYVYDGRGRMTDDKATGLGGSVDNSVRRITRTYDALDRPEYVTSYDAVSGGSKVNEVLFEYGKFGVVEKIWQDPAGAVSTTGTKSPVVEYDYQFPTDGTTALRRESTKYPDGSLVNDVYTAGSIDDIISRVSGRDLEKGSTDAPIFREAYLGLGRLAERGYGKKTANNDPVATWSLLGTDSSNNDNMKGLDRYGRIDELLVADGSTNIAKYEYEYNDRSQITVREDKVSNVYGWEIFDEIYEYDDLGRLTDFQRGAWNGTSMSSIQLHECWTLERSGNRDEYRNGTSATCSSNTLTDLSFNGSNEITSSGYTYLDAGTMSIKPGLEILTYDAWDRLVSRDLSGATVEYTYNGLNWKVTRTGDSTLPDTNYYYGAGWQVLEEENDSTGATEWWYVWGTQYIDDLVMRADGDTSADFEFQVQDARFNIVARLDDSGSPIKYYQYTGYGVPREYATNWLSYTSVSEDLHLFQGRQFHKEHEQYDFRNRWQDCDLGLFVSRDPIGQWGDPAVFGNAYSFGGANPFSLDPSGLLAPALAVPAVAAVATIEGGMVLTVAAGAAVWFVVVLQAPTVRLPDMRSVCMRRCHGGGDTGPPPVDPPRPMVVEPVTAAAIIAWAAAEEANEPDEDDPPPPPPFPLLDIDLGAPGLLRNKDGSPKDADQQLDGLRDARDEGGLVDDLGKSVQNLREWLRDAARGAWRDM